MSEEEPPPASSLPSTSSCVNTSKIPEKSMARQLFSNFSSSIPSLLTLDFDKLSLNSDRRESRYSKQSNPQSPTRITPETEKNEENMPSTEKKPQFYRTPAHKSGRFLPYDVPFQLRRRRKRSNSVSTSNPSDMEIFLKIKLKGDVEPLRMCIFDREREKLLQKPCSVQAVRPPSPQIESEEIDELSEYFTHFVRVELKMSALAESMYV